METEKYYTPKIEEFHVGFEYEQLIVNRVRNGKASVWVEKSISEIDDLNKCVNGLSIEVNIAYKYIRVKHLDI